MEQFKATIETALANPAIDDMSLREIVRQQIEEGAVPEDAAYAALLDLHGRVEDDRADDLLVTAMDYLTGYCSPAMVIGSGGASTGVERQAQPA